MQRPLWLHLPPSTEGASYARCEASSHYSNPGELLLYINTGLSFLLYNNLSLSLQFCAKRWVQFEDSTTLHFQSVVSLVSWSLQVRVSFLNVATQCSASLVVDLILCSGYQLRDSKLSVGLFSNHGWWFQDCQWWVYEMWGLWHVSLASKDWALSIQRNCWHSVFMNFRNLESVAELSRICRRG